MLNENFENLIAASQKQTEEKIFWKFPERGDLMGTIVGFNQFDNPNCGGTQYVIEIRLPNTSEIASAFLNDYLRDAMKRNNAQVGDKVIIRFLGKLPHERFYRYAVFFEKNHPSLQEYQP